ncbi:MAG: hypothetical protein IKD43_03065 [Clostridia bacterium]|nr:hypothetical protein [Clostridia bacterium]
MRKINANWKNIKGFFLAFLIVALAFLALGVGTLGSWDSVGGAYELRSKRATESSATQSPSVVFRLSNPPMQDDSGNMNLALVGVYVNVAQVYAEAGTPTTLRIERSGSGTSYVTGLNAVIENFYTEVELDEEGNPVESKNTTPVAKGALFRFVSPFAIPESGWSVSTYSYIRLSVAESNPNVLINEVVFVGAELSSDLTMGEQRYVIPATVIEATPTANERMEDARQRALALVDGSLNYDESYFRFDDTSSNGKLRSDEGFTFRAIKGLPAAAQSSFHQFTDGEIETLITIAEMRMGQSYAADEAGKAIDTYHVDNVHGALGVDILALGTLIFGMSPFGLRFFPMLAAFGVLAVLSRLVAKLTKSEKTGFIFALIYALSAYTFGFAHLGTPLMLGVFFFVCALALVYRFYAVGIRKATFSSAAYLLIAGLFGAAAMCVNGAFLIMNIGLIALFVLGMVRQQEAKSYRLEKIIAGADEENAAPEHRAGKLVAEFRFKNTAAPVLFFSGLIFGTFLLALLGMLPAYYAYCKAFVGPTGAANIFSIAWQAFANGFVGSNLLMGNPWSPFLIVYQGSTAMYACTAIVQNPIAIVAGLVGIAFAIYRLIILLTKREEGREQRAELRRLGILLGGAVISVLAALVAAEGLVSVLLAYLFSFMLAANCFGREYSEKAQARMKVVNAVGISLLAVAFVLFFVFTFSIPLPEAVMGFIFG